MRRLLAAMVSAALGLFCTGPVAAQTPISRTLQEGPSWPVFEPDFSACSADPADFGARGDGVSDDAPAIQAALDVGGHVCIRRPGTYLVGPALINAGSPDHVRLQSVLVLRPGVTLTMHPGVKLRLASGSNAYLLRNQDRPGARDGDIVIEGGQLDGNSLGQQDDLWYPPFYFGHMVVFHQADRVTVRDVYSINPYRYAFLFAGCNDVAAERIRFLHQRLNSDGVHVNGPSSRIVVRDLWGLTNDNMAGFICGEGEYFFGRSNAEFGFGDITDVLVERLHAAWAKEPVRLSGPAGTACRRFVIRDITGEVSYGMGVHFIDDPPGNLFGCEMTDIVLERIRCRVPPGYGLIAVEASGLRDLTLRDITALSPSNPALMIDPRPGYPVDLHRLEIAGLRAPANATRAIRIAGSEARVRNLIGSNWSLTQSPGGSVLDVSGRVDQASLTGINISGGTFLAKASNIHDPSAWMIDGWRFTNVSAGFVLGGSTSLDLRNGVVAWGGAGSPPLVLYQLDSAAETRVVGTGLSYLGTPIPAPVYVPRGAFSVDYPDWRMHGTSLLGPARAGDRFFNLETSVSPWDVLGVGPVVFDGERWGRR